MSQILIEMGHIQQRQIRFIGMFLAGTDELTTKFEGNPGYTNLDCLGAYPRSKSSLNGGGRTFLLQLAPVS